MYNSFTKFVCLSFFLLHAYTSQAQIWTGAVSTDWNNAGNWNTGVIPTNSGNVVIRGVGITKWPELSSSIIVNALEISNGQLDTKGFDISATYLPASSVLKALQLNGATIKNTMPGTNISIHTVGGSFITNCIFEENTVITYNGNRYDRYNNEGLFEDSNLFKRNVKFIATGTVAIFISSNKGSTYEGNVEFERASKNVYQLLYVQDNLFQGGGIVKGNFIYKNTDFKYREDPEWINYYENVSLNIGSPIRIGVPNPIDVPTITIGGNANFTLIGGYLYVSEKFIVAGTSTVTFVGKADNNIKQFNSRYENSTKPFVFTNVYIQKTDPGSVVAYDPLNIAGNLFFINGNFVNTSTLTFWDGATTSGANDKSHIVGTVSKIGNDPFTFPIGTNTKLIPVSITAPANITDQFSASYIASNPSDSGYNVTSKEPSLLNIYKEGYCNLKRLIGNSNVSVSLGYNMPAGYIKDQSKLRIAHWNGSLWENLGNGGISGSLTTGTVLTASSVTSFSPFAIASIDDLNPLPVKLIKFSVQNENQTAHLQWSTTEEINSDRFEIEYSSNAKEWIKIGELKAAKTSNSLSSYNFTHTEPVQGINYYRLKMIDVDGTHAYSEIKSLELASKTQIKLYPNPVDDILFVETTSTAIKITITNSVANEILSVKGNSIKEGINLSKLPSGTYFVKVSLSNGSNEIHKIMLSH